MRVEKLVAAAVAALEDIKARDIAVLNVRNMTSLFDRLIVASADSTRQSKSLSSHLQEKMKALGVRVRGVEGERAAEWILVDLGPVIVHIMLPAVRRHYHLEELWAAPARPRRRRTTRAAGS